MKMESELKELKSVLRSLVVSSPTTMDVRTLMRDYRNMMSEPFPLAKFGYRDMLAFIKEQCSDCFVVQDSSCNPVLLLIVPETVKHIDKFVQNQKSSATTKFKGKRRSVQESAFRDRDLIVKTFKARVNNFQNAEHNVEKGEDIVDINNCSIKSTLSDTREVLASAAYTSNKSSTKVTNGQCANAALHNFMRKRMPIFNSCQNMDSETCLDKESSRGDTDSGRQTSSSNSSNRRALLEELKMEVREVIAAVPEGVWCTELMRLYREKYGRELNFSRFGFTSVLSLVYVVEDLQYCVVEHTGELLLRAGPGSGSATAGVALSPRVRPSAGTIVSRREVSTGDPEDALPGIDFDDDVFPRDCMHLMQSIPTQSLDELAPGAMLEVVLGEVYSPTHFWLLRLGPAHYGAMEDLMDDMNAYYRGEGRERVLAGGAVRVGHYCACCYLGDWHRAVIVKIVDSDTVKVRHVDYATVEAVAARSLKPLRRCWATLPAQALRARLAGARPPAGGRRWPWAAAAHFLTLVKERRLIANVVAKDAQEGILEVLLIDTSTEEDVCISTEMCRSGHADPRPDSALGTSECYLYPRFDALESGDTPNYAEIYCYLRDGISLEFVEDYRRHVPPCLPPLGPAGPRVASPPPRDSPSPPCECSAPLCEPSPRKASPVRCESLAATMTRSLGKLALESFEPGAERAVSLDPYTETDSWVKSVAVINRIPLLCPESTASPASSPRPSRPPPQRARQTRHAQSLPPGGFPTAVCSAPVPHQSMHPSPLGSPFHPQPSASPSLPCTGGFSMFNTEQPLLHPASGPVPPMPLAAQGGVSIPVSECEIFAILNRVDSGAAHRYMVDALSRALAGTSTSASASVMPRVAADMHAERPMRPPPGFENHPSRP